MKIYEKALPPKLISECYDELKENFDNGKLS
jgi:hypothetical protein